MPGDPPSLGWASPWAGAMWFGVDGSTPAQAKMQKQSSEMFGKMSETMPETSVKDAHASPDNEGLWYSFMTFAIVLLDSPAGIMGASRDHLPLIGEVPGSPNLFAAVAFHGHGMARILTATRGLAHLLKTGTWDARLPASFDITTERLRRARKESPAVMTAEELAEEGELEMGMKELKVDGGLREDVLPRR